MAAAAVFGLTCFGLNHSYAPAFHRYEGLVVVSIVLFALPGPYRHPARIAVGRKGRAKARAARARP